MAESKSIKFGTDHDGIEVTHISSRKVLRFTCWFDGGVVGMESVEMPISEFLEKLNIRGRGERTKKWVWC